MKVLLKEDVENLGYAGEIYSVANGYGRNYLIPKGYALVATPNVLKQADAWRKKAETHRAELRLEYEALAARIQETTLTFTAKAGQTGKLYGSVTTSQIADALNEKLGTEIDRRKVGNESLRQLGTHEVVVRLSGEFQPTVTAIIESEDGPLEIEVEEEISEVEPAVEIDIVDEDIAEVFEEELA